MKIAIASDHAAFEFNRQLTTWLQTHGHEVVNFGCSGTESCDYPDFGIPAVQALVAGKVDRTILCCNNGIGMSILANKIPGAVAALVYNEECARMTREHHNSNVLCLGAQQFPAERLIEFVRLWLETEFAGGRHERRIAKARALDSKV